MLITTVCWGNICRSPMAERILRSSLASLEGGENITVNSVGVSSEEVGNPMDPRAARVLKAQGYDASGHAARQVNPTDIENTDLFVAAEDFHLDRLRALGAREDQLALMTDFDPESEAGAPLPDPWYGGAEDFDKTLDVLERAMPRLAERLVKGA
ncbi:low molecular weight phosphotyrosine protein phosphatase [Dermabacter sp. p3-SID358]|uniref:low molecular weight protein-tyrosine-phosphatase n=1 Tax=Dermabacter sp. p3-SID358 TaxID=2916114 RepID=UPI0021A5767A|nr:low molecular weight protein-tyrosine-phosphatase [Dermabacter sp. p3-SID358]MCT1867398.1 low molecular weight phosphotyrosine protein phosphatase [Dermabacter sp. p3-SID358]